LYQLALLHSLRSSYDFCLRYWKNVGNSVIFVLIYIDDLLIASDSETQITLFKRQISKRFNIVDLGLAKRFLGMTLDFKNNVMTISQEELIVKTAKKFRVTDSKPVLVPIEKDLHLEPAKNVNCNVPFRQLVGCLLYISICSRPDISFSVNFFSRFMNSYTEEHFNLLKRVLIYLYHTKDLKLTYQKSSNSIPVLECFTDADWASDKSDRKSISGHVVKFFGNVVLWTSKKQSSIALSSCESEYIVLFIRVCP
jgi:hypothetical protein